MSDAPTYYPNKQRLMFARARGARIVTWYSGKIEPVGGRERIILPAWNILWDYAETSYRVVPADQHLLYGPLSSKLIECVRLGSWKSSGQFERLMCDFGIAAEKWVEVNDEGSKRLTLDESDDMLLHLAELLANEGL